MIAETACEISLFDRWAAVYDRQPNPLLRLEERTLPALLPTVRGADVLDLGCGTGRWLVSLEADAPRSLAGCDPSSAMLQLARAKVSSRTVLHRSDSETLPSPDVAVDLILASFVLSYAPDLSAFARECARVLRPGGTLLLSDMHPVTSAERNWKRSFPADGETMHLPAQSRPVAEIAAAFALHGFAVCALEEPCLAEPERHLFEQNGKLDAYLGLAGLPAIYLLKLVKADAAAPVPFGLRATAWAISPTTWSTEPLATFEGRIASTPQEWQIDLRGYVLLPGLINAHDHLEFALYPNLGRAPDRPKYRNAPEWAEEIHRTHEAIIRQHQSVPLETRLRFGALRNLLCGVTTVCHHNPLYPELLAPEFPVRVVEDFAWAHSLSFGPSPSDTHRDASPEAPFILHAAEGIDLRSREELQELERLGLLDHRTVLVHGLALLPSDIALLNRSGASVVLCPTSNRFLFGRVTAVPILHSLARVALGSDSPLTATGDLLDEIHLLRERKLDSATLYDLVTASPAAILGLKQGEGSIARGGRADLIAVRDKGLPPAETLAALTLDDIELVLVGGRVQVASPTLYLRLPASHRHGMHRLQIGGVERWVRAPLPALFHSAEAILGPGNLRLGNKEVRHLPID